MPRVIHRRDDCRACGSCDLNLVFALRPTPIGDAYVTHDELSHSQPTYPIDLFMCRHCGLTQLLDVIDPAILYGTYIYVTASSLGLATHFDGYAKSVIERCRLASGSLVLDLGSNDGTLLRSFHRRGMNVLGVEPAAQIAAQATATGIVTIDRFFDPALAREIVAMRGAVQLVTANNVFANIDDLFSWATAIDTLLARDGVFVFESFYLADVLTNTVFDFLYHEHLSAFSVKPVQKLFERVGLELVAVEHVNTKGGSLRYFVQRANGPVGRDGSVEYACAQEEKLGLYRAETYATFAKKVDALKQQTTAFLAKARLRGEAVAGFGASITCTTLIYHFEIGEYLDFLVDDNPAKQGRYSPGLHLPVLPCTALAERKPDDVVVLAWRYAEPVIRKHQWYLDAGGCFIIPVPEFKIVASG